MSNRYWTSNPQRSVTAKAHGPAYSKDGGRHLSDKETDPPYNANIGPDGPDLNRVGFETVKAFVKARFMEMPNAASNSYDKWDAPGGFGGPAVDSGPDYAGMAGKAGEALSKVGSAMDKGNQPGQIPDSGGGNSSGGIERVQIPRSVQRRGKDY